MNEEFLTQLREAPSPRFVAQLRADLGQFEAGSVSPSKNRRRWVLPSAAVVSFLLLSSIAVPGVRNAARSLLDLFKTTTVVDVRFDPARLADARVALNSRSPVLIVAGKPEVVTGASVTTYISSGEAELQGVDPIVPRDAVVGFRSDSVRVEPQRSIRFVTDGHKLRALFDSLDLQEVSVPRRLHESAVELRLERSTIEHYSHGRELIQVARHELSSGNAPRQDLRLLAEIGLRVAGVGSVEANRLAASIDWSSTLLATFPAQASQFRDVRIHDAQALLVSTVNGSPEGRHLILWRSGNRLYSVEGNVAIDRLLAIARSSR